MNPTPRLTLPTSASNTWSLEPCASSGAAGAPTSGAPSAFRAGDVLYGKLRPYLNKVVRPNFDGMCSTDFLVFRATDSLDPKFLLRLLSQPEFVEFAHRASNGVELPRVGWKALSEYRFGLPPLAEQRRIAKRLDEVDGRRASVAAHLSATRAGLDRLRSAVLTAACSGRLTASWRAEHAPSAPESAGVEDGLGLRDELPKSWRMERVGSVFDIQNGRAFPSREYQRPGDIRLLRPGNLGPKGRVEWSERNTVGMAREWAENYRDFVLREGELLMNLTAQSLKDEFLGRACIKDDSQPALLNQRIARFRSRGTFDDRPYGLIYFKSRMFRRFVDGLDSGTLIRHMHSKQLVDHLMPMPPPDEQLEIVHRTNAMLEFVDNLGTRLARVDAQMMGVSGAVLAKAFRGELVPTEVVLAE